MYFWPLNSSQFNLMDKLSICKFFLSNNRWTMDDYVVEFEQKMAQFIGCKYAIFTSSGSTANTLIAMYLKDKRGGLLKNTVVVPSTTWITSVSPFAREGFYIKFIDINLNDFSMDLNKLEIYLKDNSSEIALVFVTSLLGFVPNIDHLKRISNKYNVLIMMDNCENTFGEFDNKNVSSYFTSTTSTYFGHQLQSVEGGFIFTDSKEEYEYFLMARNHGMVRSLGIDGYKYSNTKVDLRFDFHLLGNNFRNTNIHAYIGLRDFKKIDDHIKRRQYLYDIYYNTLDKNKYLLPMEIYDRDHSPFCLPIVRRQGNKYINPLKNILESYGIETRPIISGNLLRQTCFKYFGKPIDYLASEYLHKFGIYVGLNSKVKASDIKLLVDLLNNYE